MKFRILLLVTLLLLSTTAVFANSLRDSIGVENKDGKKVILHKVDPKDNYYSLGRKYKVSPKEIMAFNNNATMQIGVIIKVPTDRPFLESSYNTPQKPQVVVVKPQQRSNPPIPVQQPVQQQPAAQPQQTVATTSNVPTQNYKVSAGETLYSIAKRFGTTVEDITQINGLTSTTLSPGQVIKVRAGQGAAPVPPAATPVAQQNTTSVVAADSANATKFNANHYGLYEKDEKGVASWIDDADLDPNKKLVLHRTAPIGTVIKITNPMTNLTTYAKVVGRFTDNQANKDVIIVVTKNVADSLGALDKRFHVNISYGSPNE
ncbi:DPBB and LysM peptidoglycan-binding domain-containing protein [Mucilaginibacter sp.]